MPDHPDRALARERLHFLDGGRQILAHIVLHPAAARCPELPRTPVPAKVEVEHVESRRRQVVGEAPRLEVPSVAVEGGSTVSPARRGLL